MVAKVCPRNAFLNGVAPKGKMPPLSEGKSCTWQNSPSLEDTVQSDAMGRVALQNVPQACSPPRGLQLQGAGGSFDSALQKRKSPQSCTVALDFPFPRKTLGARAYLSCKNTQPASLASNQQGARTPSFLFFSFLVQFCLQPPPELCGDNERGALALRFPFSAVYESLPLPATGLFVGRRRREQDGESVGSVGIRLGGGGAERGSGVSGGARGWATWPCGFGWGAPALGGERGE